MNNKGAFDFQVYVIAIILFMGVLVTFGSMAVSMSNSYAPVGSTVVNDADFTNTYDKLKTISGDTDELKGKVENLNSGTQDSSSEFFGDALNSIKLFITSMTLGTTMAGDMASDLKLPTFWQTAFPTILIVLIVTTIIFMVVKSRGT